jgi:hypothetical protein
MSATERERISRVEILMRIKRLLAEISGLRPGDFTADQHLAKDPLNYNNVSKLALAKRLGEEFFEWPLEISPTETAACEVVRDLRLLVEIKLKEAGVDVVGIRIFGGLQ